ncbi:hypothetical protein [Paucilactobacillus sp. N302-9]
MKLDLGLVYEIEKDYGSLMNAPSTDSRLRKLRQQAKPMNASDEVNQFEVESRYTNDEIAKIDHYVVEGGRYHWSYDQTRDRISRYTDLGYVNRRYIYQRSVALNIKLRGRIKEEWQRI